MDGLLLVLNVSGFSNHGSVSLSNQVCLATQSISALHILVGALEKLRYKGVHLLVHLCLRFVHDACSMQREVSSYTCSYSSWRDILLSGLHTIHLIEGLVVAFLSWNWVRHVLQSVEGFYQQFRKLAHVAAKTYTFLPGTSICAGCNSEPGNLSVQALNWVSPLWCFHLQWE